MQNRIGKMKIKKSILQRLIVLALIVLMLFSSACSTQLLGDIDSVELKALDFNMLEYVATSDSLTYHLLIKNPEKLGLSMEKVTWGEFTQESNDKDEKAFEGFQSDLQKINRNNLGADDQLTYDTLQQYIEMSLAGSQYYYYSEPLTEYSGAQTNLPMNLAYYSIDSKADAETYLTLLADLPRYIGEILAF